MNPGDLVMLDWRSLSHINPVCQIWINEDDTWSAFPDVVGTSPRVTVDDALLVVAATQGPARAGALRGMYVVGPRSIGWISQSFMVVVEQGSYGNVASP